MSRDLLIINGVVSFIERGGNDLTIIPPDASFIAEADWKNLLGDQSEADYITALGLKVSG